jgi:hypothetical protein
LVNALRKLAVARCQLLIALLLGSVELFEIAPFHEALANGCFREPQRHGDIFVYVLVFLTSHHPSTNPK